MNSPVAASCPENQPTTGKGLGSEGSATESNLLTNGSQQQRPVYTTAGTVWNPESAKPIRAPVRRGRAYAGVFGAALGDQWAFPSQYDAGGRFHPDQAPPVLPHYSPLQQNNDRAVGPSPPLSVYGGNPEPTEVAFIEAGAGRSPSRAAMTPHSSQSDMASVKLEGGENDDVPDRSDDLRKFPMKTIVNLASYKNPSQQSARDLLRVKPNPALLSVGPPATLNNSAEGGSSSGVRRLQPLTAAAPRFVPAQLTQMHARPLVDNPHVSPNIPISTQGTHSRQLSLFPSSTLASGPGAPEPLKAGPPGQRPQGPSRIGSALAADLHSPGVSNTVQPANGVYPTQPNRQHPILDMPKETGESSIAGPLRPIPVKHYGYDGARSSKEHTDAVSDGAAAAANFNFAAHPGFRDAARASVGGGLATDASGRGAPPPGLSKQDCGRSQSRGNSSQSAGSGVMNIHQPSNHDAMSDQPVHTALPPKGQRPGPGGQALHTIQPTLTGYSSKNTASTIPCGAQFIGAYPSQVPDNGGQPMGKYCGSENQGTNICRMDSANAPYGDAGIIPGLDGGQKQFGEARQVRLQTTSGPGDAEYWNRNVDSLKPLGWDPTEYHMPYSGQYPYGAMNMDGQMLHENEARLNAWFYSNTSRLGRTIDEIFEERRYPKARPSPFGSIGDGRPAPKPGRKETYTQISTGEANKMPTSEHAKPLLSLAFQAILDFKDDESDRLCFMMNERKVKDRESEEGYDKLGSTALFPSSFSDSD